MLLGVLVVVLVSGIFLLALIQEGAHRETVRHGDVLTDMKTGCQYITNDRGAVTPRMLPDGQQACLKVLP